MNDFELLQKGYDALTKELGINFIFFTEQFNKGSGDYAKEKYEKPPLTIEQIKAQLDKYK